MPETVKATWVGPYDAHLPDGTPLISGETVVEIGADEARHSDHWRPVEDAPAPAPKPKNGGDS